MNTHSSQPKLSPTKSPMKSPTKTPSILPSRGPSRLPSRPPSTPPTMYPSSLPTVLSTVYPTRNPTRYPSQDPTSAPSQNPTSVQSQGHTRVQSQDPTSAPSNSPTIVQSYLATSAPSDGPTSAPSTRLDFVWSVSEFPAIAPTDAPTSAPTAASADNPTEAPTDDPTKAPAGAPSSPPANDRIKSPSIGPTDEPTRFSTSNPTISPTKQNTDASTEPSAGSSTNSLAKLSSHPSTPRPSLSPASTCQTQSGFFGSLTDNSYVIEFGYELETDPSVEGKVEFDVLHALENSFNSLLLPVVFPSECGGNDENTQDQFIVGITTRPDDQILEEFECRQVEVAGNLCRVVLGELTLFADDVRRSEIGDLILVALRSGMEDGSFVVAHTSIERLSFVELDDLSAGLEDAEPSSIGNSNDGLMVGLVLAAAGAALLVIGALVYRRRKNLGKGERATLEPIIIPELASSYGSMLDSEVPEVLFTPSDSSIFFDNDVLGVLSPRSELGGVLEVASRCDSTLNAKIPPDTVGIGTPPSVCSVLSSFDDDATVEPSLPPAAEDSSVSDESSEHTFPTK